MFGNYYSEGGEGLATFFLKSERMVRRKRLKEVKKSVEFTQRFLTDWAGQ